MSEKRLKVLHIIDSLGIGGAEMLLLNTINDLQEYSHVLIALGEPEDLKDRIPAVTKYYRLNFKGPENFLGTYFKLRKIIAREKPDIIHSHLYWSIILGRLVKRKAKFFFSLHGLIGERAFRKKFFYRICEKITVSRTQHMIAVSYTVYEDYLKYIPFKGKVSVIYNYIPDKFFTLSRKTDYSITDTLKIATVGSLKAVKDHQTLIKAVALLKEKYSVDIYGYGDRENKLRSLIAELKANVFLKGVQDNIEALLPKYDLFILTSVSEGHSIALLEAMALGMPLILSDIQSFKETTEEQALFFKVGDEHDLKEKIETMYLDILLRRKTAESCNVVANKYARKEKYLEQIRAIYKD